jgi:nucleoside-diphosphate-sugar epimerase
MSSTACELAREIERRVPGFGCDFVPDERQAIADSWPASLDDSAASAEWGWSPAFDLEAMVEDMLEKLRERLDQAGTLRTRERSSKGQGKGQGDGQ